MVVTIIVLLLVTVAGITRIASQSLQKIVGDKMFNVYLIPYGIGFLLSSPVIMLIQYVLGEPIVFNIKQLREMRTKELADIKALSESLLAELTEDTDEEE